jgi:hypothetical protein
LVKLERRLKRAERLAFDPDDDANDRCASLWIGNAVAHSLKIEIESEVTGYAHLPGRRSREIFTSLRPRS